MNVQDGTFRALRVIDTYYVNVNTNTQPDTFHKKVLNESNLFVRKVALRTRSVVYLEVFCEATTTFLNVRSTAL